jgi:hypothetical protein
LRWGISGGRYMDRTCDPCSVKTPDFCSFLNKFNKLAIFKVSK